MKQRPNRNWVEFDPAELARRVSAGAGRHPSGCLIWKRYLSKGYAQGMVAGRMRLIHRMVYMVAHGPIPEGLEIDHLCNNTRCVAVEHLDAKTPRANILRSNNACAWNANKTTCIRGHEFDRTVTDSRGRVRRECGTCTKENKRSYRQRNPRTPKSRRPRTAEENAALSVVTHSRASSHCPSGHEFTEANTSIRPNGHRICKECARLRSRVRRERDASL